MGGARAGTIAFIGETSFSTGVWAGIVLGAATGKVCEVGVGIWGPWVGLGRDRVRSSHWQGL